MRLQIEWGQISVGTMIGIFIGHRLALGQVTRENRTVLHKLKQFRRIATRYEKLSQTFLAFIHLVAAWISIQAEPGKFQA